jgi:selenocysteine lyase/cysteine desulfurase
LISALPSHPHIITTDSEFHSLTRQLKRLEEDGSITVTRVPSEPFHSFTDRMIEAVKSTPAAMVFFSHVFFNSAYAVPDLKKIVDAVPSKDTLVVIDGYHGFMALPTDLSAIADRAFYLAGGYKYAMAGEGCCFLHCPPGYAMRPRNTGWFADMGSLEARQGDDVPYSADGFRFWGATFDPSGLYRLNAVMEMLNDLNVGVADIHAHVMALQDQFLELLKKRPGTLISPVDTPARGHFLTFETDRAADFAQKLQDLGVVTDHRGTRLRFGFGLYHVADDVERLVTVLNTVIR